MIYTMIHTMFINTLPFINTTTIPTNPNIPISFFTVGTTALLGVLLGAALAEITLRRVKDIAEDDSGAEDRVAEEAAGDLDETYCNKYAAEFEALPLRELSEEELTNLNQYIVREQVSETLEVILTFDKATETFWYYTDHLKEVSYAILETVAQKYAIEYNCKVILQEPEDLSAQVPNADAAEPAVQSTTVFAKFKKYNAGKGGASNFTSVVKVIEQMNHFRYRGKIHDYKETQKQSEKQEEQRLDYAAYKKLLDEKKEI